MTPPTNIPAFPSNIANDFGTLALGLNQGMTLRDYFAGQVINKIPLNVTFTTPEALAEYAYKVADAMLQERLK